MEKQLNLIVKVSDEEHAELIRKDVMTALKNRSTYFYVTPLFNPRTTLETIERNGFDE